MSFKKDLLAVTEANYIHEKINSYLQSKNDQLIIRFAGDDLGQRIVQLCESLMDRDSPLYQISSPLSYVQFSWYKSIDMYKLKKEESFRLTKYGIGPTIYHFTFKLMDSVSWVPTAESEKMALKHEKNRYRKTSSGGRIFVF